MPYFFLKVSDVICSKESSVPFIAVGVCEIMKVLFIVLLF